MSSVTHKKTQKSNIYNQEISKNHENNLTGKQVVLLIPLTKFFAQKENITKLKAIIDGTSKLSLRLIDWFVTNYSKKNYIMYNLKKLQELSNPQKPQSSKARKKQSLKLDEPQSPPPSNMEDADNLLFFPSSPKSQQMEAEIEPDIESKEELFSETDPLIILLSSSRLLSLIKILTLVISVSKSVRLRESRAINPLKEVEAISFLLEELALLSFIKRFEKLITLSEIENGVEVTKKLEFGD